jgi:hypothetical protein
MHLCVTRQWIIYKIIIACRMCLWVSVLLLTLFFSHKFWQFFDRILNLVVIIFINITIIIIVTMIVCNKYCVFFVFVVYYIL